LLGGEPQAVAGQRRQLTRARHAPLRAIPRDQRREVATPLAAPAGGAGSSEEGVGFADSLLASAVTTRALRGSVPEQPRQLAELGARLRLRTLHLVGTRHRFSLSLACGQGSEAATFDGRSSPQRAMDFGTVDSAEPEGHL